MERMYRFSKERNVVNLASSILNHYGIPSSHPGILEVMEKMKSHAKIAFLLFDGMGKSLLEKHLSTQSFLRQHVCMTLDSVFPPTTVAATNALLSGKYPCENLWLGWSQYFSDIDKHLDVFSNRDTWTKELSPYPDPMKQIATYQTIFSQVKEKHPQIDVAEIFPSFRPGGAETLGEWFSMIDSHLQEHDAVLLYGYWTSPDHEAHDFGTDSVQVKACIETINDALERFTEAHPDTLFFVLADHSLIDVEFLLIDEHPDFFETLIRPFSIEPRAATFFVKPEKRKEFETLFDKYYGKWFDLYPKEEVQKRHLFGYGKDHPLFSSFLGDYLAVSIDRYCFDYILPSLKESIAPNMIGAHAGGTKEETQIALMMIEKEKK